MKKIKVKELKIILISIILLSFGYNNYYYYDKVITFPDNNKERIIRNIIFEHNIVVDKKRAISSNLNNIVKSFGGEYRVVKVNNDIEFTAVKANRDLLVCEFYEPELSIFSTKEEYDEYMFKTYKYYNKDMLEIILLLFNNDCGTDLSAEDIAQYVDDGNRKNQDIIKQYFFWYYDVGRIKLYNYKCYYDVRLINKIRKGEETSIYGTRRYNELTWKERKEVINSMIIDNLEPDIMEWVNEKDNR